MALKLGTLDGAVPGFGDLDSAGYKEVIKYVNYPPFLDPNASILVGMNSWKKLSPDVQKAVAHWQQAGPQFARSTRVCAGFDFSASCAPQALAVATLEGRWEAALRESFWGRWSGRAVQLERLQRA